MVTMKHFTVFRTAYQATEVRAPEGATDQEVYEAALEQGEWYTHQGNYEVQEED